MRMVFFFVSLLIFIASLMGAAAVFFAEKFYTQQINQKSAQLKEDQQVFDLATIEDLARLDTRMKNAESLMQRHYTALTVLLYLGDQTLQNVQFTDYKYSIDPDGVGKITLVGVANGFGTVALQSDQFSASKKLKNVVFSNIQIDPSGKGVGFNVSATLDQSLTSYADSLGSTSTAQPGLESTTTAPSAATSSAQIPATQ